MAPNEWIVHPNRSALGPDQPGHNGHYRTVGRAPTLSPQHCQVTIRLPIPLQKYGDSDGTVTFDGSNWRFVVAAARSFAVDYSEDEVLAPFGFTSKGRWWWWDGSTTDYSILDTSDAEAHVRRYLEGLFPAAVIVQIADLR
ncbi:hypothetical protein AOT93_05320 [Mycobacteroides sp. H110]|nr:hypothetical protein AOT91_22970 [Mycobacteroides sp. H092]KRQ23450.1 hypothetical protein AOT87_12230 [Mycobacteroides sp. H003]KRQ40260.1 hypothetical protein AOT92_14860 [Mycobacteroides sp. H101]KRQ47427.1 hypothetical protein AOT88_16060 [Mycobacteroides sp. H063]KRQ57708.1 hypothetical protein AOT90_25620 [Mycobacteroides sp. H079]KRQ77577.1 hypothetical protein AOT95_22035 [Mycobacteroides sp. HXXIII]KRQ84329.1 hypothetical protein AOT93_05320 [Mycobacteroides sp. H110]